jgi:hypothetical protein
MDSMTVQGPLIVWDAEPEISAQRHRGSFFAGCLKEDDWDCLFSPLFNCLLMAHYRHILGHLLIIYHPKGDQAALRAI